MSTDPKATALTRRGALFGAATAVTLAVLARPQPAWARGRIPVGGRVSIRVPWPLRDIDPHRLDDASSMLFGACLFDSLYATNAAGEPTPALAENLPEPFEGGTRVTLREGVTFASGRVLTAKDVEASIARARTAASRGWLDALGPVRALSRTALLFEARASERVAALLASPLVAIVPKGFVPSSPDGTGPFVAHHEGEGLVLLRNPRAASGPSFLDALAVAPAKDLAESLRAFESGEDDLGWLGLGLHEPRRGAVPFDAGVGGWAVLRTGDQAGRWSLPGVAQRLADGIEPLRLAQLGIRESWAVLADEGWGGSPADLLVRADSPWLAELGRSIAAALSRPDHTVTVRLVAPEEFATARASRAYSLAVDLVRPFDQTALGAYVALHAADDAIRGLEAARHPPRAVVGSLAPRALGRLLRLGVVAEVRPSGGRMPDLDLPRDASGTFLDFGAITRPRSRVL